MLETAQEIANVGSWALYIEGNRQVRTLWSAQLCRIFGVAVDALPRDFDAYLRFVHPEDRALTAEKWTEALDTDSPYELEHRIVRPDGEERVIYTKALSIRDQPGEPGGIKHWIGASSDITERKEADEALRASEAHLRQAQRIARIGSWEYNETRDEYIWSDEVFRIYGVIKGEFTLNRESVYGIIHPDDHAIMFDVRARAEKGETNYSYDYRIVRPDGETRTLRNMELVIERQDGKLLHRAGTVQDITEQASTEEHLRQAMKMEAVGQLTGGVAHDFNNLLTVMLVNLELLKERFAEDEKGLRFVDMALAAGGRGAELTHRLLAFSRKQPLNPDVIDINKLIPGTGELLRRTLGENIEIESVLAGGLWKAMVDRSQLENALLNLAINARDAMPGGGKLTIETANTFLDADYARQRQDLDPGQYVMIAVSDTGSGMAPEVLHRVFDPFFTTKNIGEGSGLGLSMVYGFAKQSGGHAAIYSEPGHGTSVKIYLPRVSGAETGPANVTGVGAARSARGGEESLLVVEDDEAVREIIASALRAVGYEVTEAPTGEAALAQLAVREFSLLITDVILPGNLTCRDIADAAQARHPGIRVLYVSGYARNAIVHQGKLDDGVNLLSKPFTRETLVQRVREALDTPEA